MAVCNFVIDAAMTTDDFGLFHSRGDGGVLMESFDKAFVCDGNVYMKFR